MRGTNVLVGGAAATDADHTAARTSPRHYHGTCRRPLLRRVGYTQFVVALRTHAEEEEKLNCSISSILKRLIHGVRIYVDD